jgi:hypothetical protein
MATNTKPGLPDEVVINVHAGSKRLGGALVEIELPMDRKNPYHLIFGPADGSGYLKLTRADLVEAARKVIDGFPMDYVSLTATWAGSLSVTPVGRTAIGRLREASKLWDSFYPPKFAGQLDELEEELTTVADGAPVEAHVTIKPAGTCRVEIRRGL